MSLESLAFTTRYVPGQKEGHYESFYQRGNHPDRPLAFWIRYTIFSPKGRSRDAIGELWSIFFDGETGRHVAAKEEYPLAECAFSPDKLDVRVADRTLTGDAGGGTLTGEAVGSGNTIGWDLTYAGDAPPVYLIPRSMYTGGFPKAKSLVGVPLARYRGTVTVNGQPVEIDDWVGSQNHNWGSQHTDYYAFGQVAGFDNAPDAFLEVITAQTKVGPIKTPFMTLLVLRVGGREYELTSPNQARKAKGRFGYFDWTFTSETDDVRIEGHIAAPADAFVGLNYYNPPGGIKHCLNTKIGSCELTVTDKRTGATQTLRAANRALFEILTDDRGHGVEIRG